VIDTRNVNLTPAMRKRFEGLLAQNTVNDHNNNNYSTDEEFEPQRHQKSVEELKIDELRELVNQIQNGATFFKLVGGLAANLSITTSNLLDSCVKN
jgi:hypothetical protein